jgi:cytochrome c6
MLTSSYFSSNDFVASFQPSPKIHLPNSSLANLKTTSTSKIITKNDVNVDHHPRQAAPIHIMASALLLSTLLTVVSVPSPCWSQQPTPDITKGQVLFQANCAGCHAGGNNYVQEKRTLRKDDIQQYRGSTDQAVIMNFVQNGMPHKFLPMKVPMENKDYNDVVGYVLDQALGEKW